MATTELDDDGYQPSALRRERLAYRQKQTVLSILIAAVSTAVIGGVAMVAMCTRRNSPRHAL